MRTERRSRDEIEKEKKKRKKPAADEGMMTEGERVCSSGDGGCGVPAGVLVW